MAAYTSLHNQCVSRENASVPFSMHSGLELASQLEPSLLQQTSDFCVAPGDFSADLAAQAQERHNVQQTLYGDTRKTTASMAILVQGEYQLNAL